MVEGPSRSPEDEEEGIDISKDISENNGFDIPISASGKGKSRHCKDVPSPFTSAKHETTANECSRKIRRVCGAPTVTLQGKQEGNDPPDLRALGSFRGQK